MLRLLLHDVDRHDRNEPTVGDLAEHDDRETEAHRLAELVVRSTARVLAGRPLLVGVAVERVAMIAVVVLAVGVAHDRERAGVRGRIPDPLADILDALGPEAEIDTAEPLARQYRVLSELRRERMHQRLALRELDGQVGHEPRMAAPAGACWGTVQRAAQWSSRGHYAVPGRANPPGHAGQLLMELPRDHQ